MLYCAKCFVYLQKQIRMKMNNKLILRREYHIGFITKHVTYLNGQPIYDQPVMEDLSTAELRAKSVYNDYLKELAKGLETQEMEEPEMEGITPTLIGSENIICNYFN